MNGQNITKCANNIPVCLTPGICCYECDHKGWCSLRCENSACRRKQIKRRLNKEGIHDAGY